MGPSPVDRRRPGSKHHVACDGKGIPLAVPTTGGNVHDVTVAVDLVDAIPPVAGRPGRPRMRPDAILADKAYDSTALREALQHRNIQPIIPRRGTIGILGLGKIRWVVERTIAWLHQFKRLAIRWEHHTDLHNALISLACAHICYRHLKT